MWLFTKYGMYSIVQSSENPNHMLIRSRVRSHLTYLKKTFNLPTDVITTPKADYRFRLITTRDVAVSIITELAKDIDYSNFKHAAHDHLMDHGYSRALNNVWGEMHELQERTIRRR